jgi:phospholipid-transporting ATPase
VNQPNTTSKKLDAPDIFVSNRISTAKYTWWNFLPKNLFLQLSKMANIYFLIVLALQVIRPISISGGQPSILLPLAFVIGMSVAKDVIEDLKRKRSDREENESTVLAAKRESGTFERTKWEDVRVG